MNVWVLDFDAKDDDTGEFVAGYQSVHATKESAVRRVFDRLHELGYDPRKIPVITSVDAEDGSTSADLDGGELAISYGIHNMPVEE